MEPLFKYRQKCSSMKRSEISKMMQQKYRYDPVLSVMTIKENDKFVPAILSINHEAVLTKKRDVETGEDEKDLWMWQ